MSITAGLANPSGVRVYMGVITAEPDLHEAIRQIAVTLGIRTASFDVLGGLTRAEFSAYDFTTQTRAPSVILDGALEIAAGHGTISLMQGGPDAPLHVHIHALITYRDPAAPNGIGCAGGHLAKGEVYAVEYTLHAYDGAPIHRAEHPATGLRLWDITPLTKPDSA